MSTDTEKGSSITTVYIEKLLNYLRKEHLVDFFEQNETWLIKYGMIGLYVAALVGLAFAVICPIRYEMPWGLSLGFGFGWVVACIFFHYVAVRLLPVVSNLIKTTPTNMSSTALLDSMALLCCISGVAVLATAILGWVKTSEFGELTNGILAFIAFEYLVALCLNPRLVNIAIEEKTRAGQEFIGVFSFFLKGFLKLIPIMFGSWIIIGVVKMVILLFTKPENFELDSLLSIGWMLIAAVLPLAGYLIFISYYFFIDLAVALLSIPAKLDRLGAEKGGLGGEKGACAQCPLCQKDIALSTLRTGMNQCPHCQATFEVQ
jgi:hypothetical protein